MSSLVLKIRFHVYTVELGCLLLLLLLLLKVFYLLFKNNCIDFFIGHTAQVCLLLKHKADQYLKDQKGVEPLQVAIHQANADIVTLYV